MGAPRRRWSGRRWLGGTGGSLGRRSGGNGNPAARARAPRAAGAAAAPGPGEGRGAVGGGRSPAAAAVSESAFPARRGTEFRGVGVTAMMAAVGRLRELPEFAGLRVSPLLLVAKA